MNELAEHQDILDRVPLDPVELEFMIQELSDRLERSVPVLRDLWEQRYQTEREYIRIKGEALLNATGYTVAEKRAEADLTAMEAMESWQAAKTTLHAAEELQKALRAKLYGLLNLNKSVTATYQAVRS